jgi:hypothetical protein
MVQEVVGAEERDELMAMGFSKERAAAIVDAVGPELAVHVGSWVKSSWEIMRELLEESSDDAPVTALAICEALLDLVDRILNKIRHLAPGRESFQDAVLDAVATYEYWGLSLPVQDGNLRRVLEAAREAFSEMSLVR